MLYIEEIRNLSLWKLFNSLHHSTECSPVQKNGTNNPHPRLLQYAQQVPSSKSHRAYYFRAVFLLALTDIDSFFKETHVIANILQITVHHMYMRCSRLPQHYDV